MRDLTEASQALEACIVEGHQGQPGSGKRRLTISWVNLSSLPFKKLKGEQCSQFKKRGGDTNQNRSTVGSFQGLNDGSVEGQSNVKGSSVEGASE